jgi:hypothetical protein
VARPWTDVEKRTIAARNHEYGREQQKTAMYECRRIMTTLVTFEIVSKGLNTPLMRKVATQIAEECTSTDSFKAKLTQIEEFNQAMGKKRRKPAMGQKSPSTLTQSARRNEKRREKSLLTCKGCQERGHRFHGHTD